MATAATSQCTDAYTPPVNDDLSPFTFTGTMLSAAADTDAGDCWHGN